MLYTALIYLVAAIVAVPIAKRAGLGSVLGYLLAGVIIGPFVLALVGDQTDVMHFAEFGVVMMLFLVGLELRPGRLWKMRKPIIGLGGLQVLLTASVISYALILLTPLAWQTCVAIGGTLALSSTAIVLQSLTERGLLKTSAGQNAFAVLLFQDIAVIPLLAILPLLAVYDITQGHTQGHSLIDDLPVWGQIAVSIGTILVIIIGGKYLAAPIFRYIAETRLREIFTAFALLLVVAIASLMQSIGLSAALGTFLAGVVLAESEFRHELETDIEPFKGLLLGLFFITVGASIDFNVLMDNPLIILLSVIGLILVKGLILAALARLFKLDFSQGLLFALALAQGGEFAFVVVSSGTQFAVFDQSIGSLITVVVALSMLVSPLLFIAYEWYMSRIKAPETTPQADTDIEPSYDVIVAGFGRFGQVVSRLLTAQGFQLTILDHSPSQVEMVRRFGNKVHYGDASRKDLLEAAGAHDAKLLVIAVDEADKTIDIVKTAQKHFPHLKILARAIDRRHAYQLIRLDVDGFRRETFDSALTLGKNALTLLGVDEKKAELASRLFAQQDEQAVIDLAELWGDDVSYGVAIRQRLEDLKEVLKADQKNQAESNQSME